jgi:lipopolysaccharide/colanic/teichoic acid biosynthesis glycosyltransferase
MAIKNRQEPLLLLGGDIIVFFASLWLSLHIRYGDVNEYIWSIHMWPFIVIFAASVLIFFISGAYEKHTSHLQSKLPVTLLYSQISIAFISSSLLYLFISTFLLFAWRIYGSKLFSIGEKGSLILIGKKNEIADIAEEIGKNKQYLSVIEASIDVDGIIEEEIFEIFKKAGKEKNTIVVAPSENPKVAAVLSRNFDFVLSYVNFLDIHEVYEHMFDRVPLEAVNYSLIAEANRGSVTFYDICKRLIDIVIAAVLALVTFPFFPLIALAIKLDHKGPVFITQQRVGKRGKVIDMYKFRTMTASDEGKWLPDQTENRVTRIGAFLRKSRIDELPQLVNVLRGDISLIGPRPDIIGLGEKLVGTIPFYMARYAVLPGLSGWAQIQQKPPQSIEETELRFSYDLFYVKNRSLFLDIRIALRTLKTLLSRTGM